MRRTLALVIALGALTGPFALAPAMADGSSTASPNGQFAITSPEFPNGGVIPKASTCVGLGLGNPPALAWSGLPAGTAELALIVTDPEGVTGTIDHWVVYGIPTSDAGSAHGAAPVGATQGLNSFLLPLWLPPCAPSSTPHHYVFTLYALNAHLPTSGLLPLTAQQLSTAMKGHVLAQTSLVGLSALLG